MLAKVSRALLTVVFFLGLCPTGSAHPMGNFSVNHYSKITLENDRIYIRYFIDLAEIPTYQELQRANVAATGADPKSPEVIEYVKGRGAELGRGLILTVDGESAALRLLSSAVIFPAGAGGLPTMKMGFVYEASYSPIAQPRDATRLRLHYADTNFPGHAGWKEIVADASRGTLVQSTVPSTDRSRELSNYPTDLLSGPPQDLEASISAMLSPATDAPARSQSRAAIPILASAMHRVRGKVQGPMDSEVSLHTRMPAAAPSVLLKQDTMQLEANQQKTPRSRFTEMIGTQHLSAWFLFTAVFIAIGLGGLHALEPGHGKTIVAAYLVGSKGTARHAMLLGLIVTASHTAGVFALGAITLYASRYIVPEQLYPWLGVLSGATMAGLGSYMLLRRLSGTATDHSHASGSSHGRWMFWKRAPGGPRDCKPGDDITKSGATVSVAQLFALGLTGGIIPCPAALIVLLSAFALHRVALGFVLIVAFSVGLAAVLIGFGMAMVYAGRFITRLHFDGPLTTRWLPVASSAFIVVLGGALAIQALSTIHLSFPDLFKEKLGPLLFIAGLGLVLGMRHSTDADHVVAISTIVNKQRSIRNAAFIGSVWGLGHTITIFAVGSLIILFGVEIPPRLGLSMEFCVAVMLILLGVLNLTGVMQKVTSALTPLNWKVKPGARFLTEDEGNYETGTVFGKFVARFGLYQCIRPLVIGLVHGLAGSAAVALLVLSTIHDPVWATFYLLIFGTGTMMGMMFMTSAIAVPLAFAGDRFNRLSHYFGVASGMASLGFGTFLVYQLGFLGGLFTNHPQWTPR